MTSNRFGFDLRRSTEVTSIDRAPARTNLSKIVDGATRAIELAEFLAAGRLI
jgi:hypothetical protein